MGPCAATPEGNSIAVGRGLYLLFNAETALTVLGRVENARRAIEKARRAAELVRAHINEPNHVPADSVDRINERP
jgi:hypothetical protein